MHPWENRGALKADEAFGEEAFEAAGPQKSNIPLFLFAWAQGVSTLLQNSNREISRNPNDSSTRETIAAERNPRS